MIWNLEVLIGHERIWQFLVQSAARNRLAHAYLFVGPPEVGKKKVALEFAKILQCQKSRTNNEHITASCGQCSDCRRIEQNQHPDVSIIEPNNQPLPAEPSAETSKQIIKAQEIKIGQIRQLQHQINLSPFSGFYKVVIIDWADQMTLEAANSLLKTLEEPPPKSLLILISSNWQKIPLTIISRCQLIKFSLVKKSLITQSLKKRRLGNESKIEQAVRICCGRPGRAIKLLDSPDFWNKQEEAIDDLQKLLKKDLVTRFKYIHQLAQNSIQAQEILDQWIIWFRDQILISLGTEEISVLNKENPEKKISLKEIVQAIKNIQWAQSLLSESSFNARLILENLMLKI